MTRNEKSEEVEKANGDLMELEGIHFDNVLRSIDSHIGDVFNTDSLQTQFLNTVETLKEKEIKMREILLLMNGARKTLNEELSHRVKTENNLSENLAVLKQEKERIGELLLLHEQDIYTTQEEQKKLERLTENLSLALVDMQNKLAENGQAPRK
ncbi:TPA: hypothetical protein H1011_00145 [archaeon]|uniref:Uncharacterized protein n=1 Tax=Candidatus Undinarchaeum marinum TaxID=2756141 RepID=A0A832X4V0_9ARCH|nr:hypothetical protein [Candidatus Undinarchaeum marinum]